MKNTGPSVAKLENAARDMYHALKGMIDGKVITSQHAVHPSGRFCEVCGRNSEIEVHSHGCPVLAAETAIAKAEGR